MHRTPTAWIDRRLRRSREKVLFALAVAHEREPASIIKLAEARISAYRQVFKGRRGGGELKSQ